MFGLPDIVATRASTWRGAWAIVGRHAERNLSFAFLGFAALCLVVPFLQTLYPIFGTIVAPVEERRALSPFPSLRLLLGANGDFAAALNTWFDDRVGFRDLFIRAKNQIDYTLFDTSKKVWIGSDGWLFLRDDPRNISDLDAAQLAILEDGFVTLARQLHDRDVHLLVIGLSGQIGALSGSGAAANAATADRRQLRTLAAIPRRALRTRVHRHRSDDETPEARLAGASLLQDRYARHRSGAILPSSRKSSPGFAQTENRPDVRWDEKLTLSHARWNHGS